MEIERLKAEYESIAAPLRQIFIGPDDGEALRNKINATLMILSGNAVSNFWKGEGEEPLEHKVRRALWMDSRLAIRGVLKQTFDELLWIIKYRDGDIAEDSAEILIDVLTQTLNQLKSLYGDERPHELFKRIAKERIEFPSLLSIFTKENLDMDRLVREKLQLGADQQFSPDPRKTYSPYSLLAMDIVRWIDFNRERSDSVYRTAVPGIEKMVFCEKHAAAWTSAIEFHLDFYQAPKKTRDKTAWNINLLDAYEQNEAYRARAIKEERDTNGELVSSCTPGWLFALGAFGEITEMREFKGLLKSGKDKQVKGKASLYSRVRGKIIEAAMGLMPKMEVECK